MFSPLYVCWLVCWFVSLFICWLVCFFFSLSLTLRDRHFPDLDPVWRPWDEQEPQASPSNTSGRPQSTSGWRRTNHKHIHCCQDETLQTHHVFKTFIYYWWFMQERHKQTWQIMNHNKMTVITLTATLNDLKIWRQCLEMNPIKRSFKRVWTCVCLGEHSADSLRYIIISRVVKN